VIALSHQYFENVSSRLRPGSLVVAEETIAGLLPDLEQPRFEVVPAIAIATEAGNRMAAGMVMAGAYAALTGVVSADSLVAAMKEQVPAYRSQHIATNERAIHAGAQAVPRLLHPIDLGGDDGGPRKEMVA
jgi:2-oxoglutarate ferredoxin oxidoreductase subunit gamma